MHKVFYASGFIYHPKSEKILLQKKKLSNSRYSWVLFSGKNKKKETEKETFKRLIDSLFKLNIDSKKISEVYSYFHNELKKENFVYYASVTTKSWLSDKDEKFKWFSFKDVLKIEASEQTKHDIIVSQRVIASSIRKKLGQKTIG